MSRRLLGMPYAIPLSTILSSALLIIEIQGSNDGDFDYDCYYWDLYSTVPAKSPWASRCSVITAAIRIGPESNLTEGQLEKLFQNISTIRGSILVQGTKLKRLNFLKNVVKINTYYTDYVLEIIDNPLLTHLNFNNFASSDGMVSIQRNPLLNTSSFCKQLDEIVNGNWIVSGNKVDCKGYQLDFPLTFTSILTVPSNLTVIHGNIVLRDIGIPLQRLTALSSVKKLAGCLLIEHTNLETLSFLGNLEEIDCRSTFDAAIRIYSNNYLNYLGLSKLTKIGTVMPIVITANRILETGFEEVRALASTSVPTTEVSGIYPTEDLPPDICTFNSMTDDLVMLNLNCTSLVGLLYYEQRSFSKLEVEILQRMRNIYGNIELVNINITDLSIFSALERVISFNESQPAIQLKSMSGLESIEMPKLQLTYAPSLTKFAIENCPNIGLSLSDCNGMDVITRKSFTINGTDCRQYFEYMVEPT